MTAIDRTMVSRTVSRTVSRSVSRNQSFLRVGEKRNHKRSLTAIIFGAITVVFISFLGISWYFVEQAESKREQVSKILFLRRKSQLQQQHEVILDVEDKDEEENDIEELPIAELDHEENFQNTIKSCLPFENDECQVYIPAETEKDSNTGRDIQHVALIAPPGDLSRQLLNEIERITNHYNEENKDAPEVKVHITTHVPPYGEAGKAHRYSKILRLTSYPISLQVTDALYNLLEPNETYKIITVEDMKSAFRQIMRFHCRLSHMAEQNTAIESISMLDMISNDVSTSKQIRRFLFDSKTKTETVDKEEEDDDTLETEEEQDGVKFLDEVSYGARINAYVQKQVRTQNKSIYKIFDQVLTDELSKTNDLSNYPCESFWSPYDENKNESNQEKQLSPIIQRLAKALSPDCNNDPFVTCSHPRDICEAAGDAKCVQE